MWSPKRAHITMTLVVVTKNNTHAMTLVDPWVDCEKKHTCNDTSGSIGGM